MVGPHWRALVPTGELAPNPPLEYRFAQPSTDWT